MLEFKYVKSKFWQTFILSFLLAFLLFLPISLQDAMQGNVFHYAGDYNNQSMLFWQYANEFVKSGGTFSWVTELGSGFVNSYSYYMLGCPLFWASLWVPAKWMPWAMIPLFCLKFAFAGAGGYLWTKRWVNNSEYAILAGILYAFCGYNIYSIFYNSFIDVTALFPYLLTSLDDSVIDGKKARFPIWVAVCLLTNYYFFVGEAIFLILYFICMIIGKKYKLSISLLGRMALETIIGMAAGAVLIIPAVVSLSQNPRTSSFLNDYGFITYSEPQKYMAIFASMFIMPDAPYQNTMFGQAGTAWQNVCAYLPVVGITGGVALCRAKRKHPFARLLKFCVVAAFIPMLNAVFTLESSRYYARWYFMPILVLCGVTGMVLDSDDIYRAEWKDAWKTVLVITMAFVAIALVPSNVPIMGFKLGVASSATMFWTLWSISIAGVILCGIICKRYRGTQKFISAMMCGVMVFSFVYGECHMMLTRYTAEHNEGEHTWYDGYKDLDNVKKLLPTPDDSSDYRIDTMTESNYNIPLGFSGEDFFSSTVSPGIFSFYASVGHGRSVEPTESQDAYAFRSLLGVKYLIVGIDSEKSWNASVLNADVTITKENANSVTQLLNNKDNPNAVYELKKWASNWEEVGRTSESIVYENQNYVPIGFTYDYYITEEQLSNVDLDVRSNLLLKAVVLNDEQIGKYGKILKPLPDEEFENCTFDDFRSDCSERRSNSVVSFKTNNYGFTAATNYTDDELVFFSVPYEKSAFTATVNGEPIEVESVNCGLMAIPVSAGDAEIVVTYRTPGLKASTTISMAGIAVWVVYAFVCCRRKKHGNR